MTVPAHGHEGVPRMQSKQKDFRWNPAGETEPMTHEHMARHSAPRVAREMQIKTTRKYRYTLIKHICAL